MSEILDLITNYGIHVVLSGIFVYTSIKLINIGIGYFEKRLAATEDCKKEKKHMNRR